MKKIALIAIAVLALSGCSDAKTARHALDAEGYTDIEITGWSPFSCSDDDTFSTGFVATNSKGKRVRGTVCSGILFKNATIRW